MKKWLLGFLCSASLSSTYAQGLQVGLKAGLNLACYTGLKAWNTEGNFQMTMKRQAGFQGGVTLAIPLGRRDVLSLQPELLYSQRGYRFKDRDQQVNAREHYLDLPLVLQLHAQRLRFQAGPQVSYMLAHLISWGYGPDKDNVIKYQNPNVDKLALGVIVGIGYQLPSGVNFAARYNANTTGIKAADSVIQFVAGYTFGHHAPE